MRVEELLIIENLRKLVPAWSGSLQALPHDALMKFIAKDFASFSSSSRTIEFDTDFDVRDMAWNHMDFTHRPCVHHQYIDGLRIVLGSDVQVGFTPWQGTPFLFPTFDVRTSEREFLHGYNIAGLFYVFMKISFVEQPNGHNAHRLEWSIVSKWYLKFLHPLLHWKTEKLNRRLFAEDIDIKTQRKALRRRGYVFLNDNMNFYESTRLHPTNIRRPAAPPVTVELASLPLQKDSVVKSGEREFIVFRTGENSVTVWDGICTHQGASLTGSERCDRFRVCPWHALKLAGVSVDASKPEDSLSTHRVKLSGTTLEISPLIDA